MPTLKDIAKLLVQKHELKQRDAETFMTAFVDTILDGLKTDRQVKIKGFGTFKVTAVRERESVNVNTGERVVISGHDKISFTPDAVMRDIVNKPFAQFETVILADGVNFDDMPESVDDADNESTGSEQNSVEENVAQIIPLNADVEQQELSPAGESMTKDDVMTSQPETEETALQAEPLSAATLVSDQEPEIEEEQPQQADETPQQAEETPQQAEEIAPQTEEEPQQEKQEAQQDTLHDRQASQQEEAPGSVEENTHGEHHRKSHRRHRKGDDDDCRKIFIVYAVVANIVFASIAFVLGYLCAENNWLGLNYGNDRVAVMPAEYVENAAPAAQQTSALSNDSLAKKTEKDAGKSGDSVNVNDRQRQEKALPENNDAKDNNAKEEKKQAGKPVTANQAKQTEQASSSKYDADPRVRTGAYTITGTAATVKVRAGQTLKSISKSYLGEGMECYVEAYNGGIKEVTAGQTVKIPQLQLKKRRK